MKHERILFSCPTEKKNKWGFKQYRTILITNIYIYNIDDNKIQRKIEVKDLQAFTYGKDCDDFILHVKDEYDY